MELTEIQLNQLLLVDALLTHASISEAADKIGMSQSAASHALGRLRTELNDPIFIRTANGMQPTPFGARLAGSVKEALALLRGGLEQQPNFVPQTSTHMFTVIMSEVSQTLYLSKLLTRLAKEAPGTLVRIAPVPQKAPHLELESGEVDLAVGTFTHFIAGCRQKHVYREQYACIARGGHPMFAEGMTAKAFSASSHVIVDPTGYVHEQLSPILKHNGLARNAKVHVPTFHSVPEVVANTDLIAVMPETLADFYATLLPLLVMPLPIVIPSYGVKMFWHERFHRDPKNRWLRNVFIDLYDSRRIRNFPSQNL